MKIKTFIFNILLCLSVLSCTDRLKPDEMITFKEVSPMPVPTANAACAVVGDVAYVYGGRTPDGISGSLYSYTAASDRWTELQKPPLASRTGAVAANHGDHIYMGLGFNGGGVNIDDNYLRDWWRFTPETGEWVRLADYPSDRTAAASSFVHEDGIYICFGYYNDFHEDVFRYDIPSDSWKKLDTNSRGGRVETVAGEVDGRYFAGTTADWWEFYPSESRWEKRSYCMAVPQLVSSSIFAFDDCLYIVGGRQWSTIRPDGRILRYDPAADRWAIAGRLPQEGGKENMISFIINGIPYIGLGEEKEKINSKTYRLTIN